MAVVWCRHTNKTNSASKKKSDKGADNITMEEGYLVRCDSPNTPKLDVVNAPLINIGDPHPDVPWIICQELSAKATDDTGLLWVVTAVYSPYVPGDTNNSNTAELPYDKWTASGSSKSIPCFRDRDGDIIRNSAKDALEGMSREKCEYTLNLVRAYAHHNDWLSVAGTHVDRVNSGAWHGGAPETWLCRFRSANLEVKVTEDACLIYWLVQWEFAFDATTWRLRPWDIGFHQLVGGAGGGSMSSERKVILGADGKGVKQPVALNADGTAKAAGQPPDVLKWKDGSVGIPVFGFADFSIFGNIYTPNC